MCWVFPVIIIKNNKICPSSGFFWITTHTRAHTQTNKRQQSNSENEYRVSTVCNHWSIHLHPQSDHSAAPPSHIHTHTRTLVPPTHYTHTLLHPVQWSAGHMLAHLLWDSPGTPHFFWIRVCVHVCVFCKVFTISSRYLSQLKERNIWMSEHPPEIIDF